MNIEYLNQLEQNPSRGSLTNEPLTIAQIQQLEDLYNAGNPFPKALRELLYLAGGYCIVVSTGIPDIFSLQQDVRAKMLQYSMALNRPFFAFDARDQNTNFLFVHLDEEEDPWVYTAYLGGEEEGIEEISKLYYNLSGLINKRIEKVKQGFNHY